jgi:hypothetical protein
VSGPRPSLVRLRDARAWVYRFSVHGTSMTNKNQLVSADNKGVASVLFEKVRLERALGPG